MTNPPEPEATPEVTRSLEKTLTAALKTRPLDEESLERIRAAVGAEWRAATGSPWHRSVTPRHIRWTLLGVAASILAVLIAFWIAAPSTQGAIVGSVSRLAAVGIDVGSGFFHHRTVRVGEALRVGDEFTASGSMLITFRHGGSLRVAAGTRLSMVTSTRLSLERGLIYVDFPASIPNPLRVSTTAGDIEHIGTEFEVMSDGQGVRIRVREGRIRLSGKAAPVAADAGTELLAMPGAEITRRPVDTYGRDWIWLAELAPDYDIDGRPLMDFLQWSSRELGRHLDFADERSRQIAEHTILHGSVRGQLPADALSHVLTTTSLAYEIRNETIWVHASF